MSISKKFFSILLLNVIIVFIINFFAFIYSAHIDLQYVSYILIAMIVIAIVAILVELLYFLYQQIRSWDRKTLIFLWCIWLFFLLKEYFFWEYFFFRFANSYHFARYFEYMFYDVALFATEDFRNYNGMVLINLLKSIIPNTWDSIYYIYTVFQFIWTLFLYRLLSSFSKNNLLIIWLILLYYSIEIFFVISITMTYVNIILPSFIIFIYYIFHLDKKQNTFSYVMYFLAYIFLITWRPDFYFIAIIIEFLNAYLSDKKIISVKQNILFYILLIPYYFIVNSYLLNRVFDDRGLVWEVYPTDNFWKIFIDRTLGNEMIQRAFRDIEFILTNEVFIITFIITNILVAYLYLYKKSTHWFYISFLLIYTLLYFCIVIFIHEEGYKYSHFKYFSLIYIIYYIVLCISLLKLDTLLQKKYKIILYTTLCLFISFNFYNSVSNNLLLKTKLQQDNRTHTNEVTDVYDTEKFYERTYHTLFNENRKAIIWKYLNHTNEHR